MFDGSPEPGQDEWRPPILLDRSHFHYAFDTALYLRDFYERVEEPAMKLIITFLPNIVARLPPGGRVLDVGSGPTIHVAVAFRHHKDEIYLSDYLPQNRAALGKWLSNKMQFNWQPALRILAIREGQMVTQDAELALMENQTRQKIRAIVHCDVHETNIVPSLSESHEGFEVVTSFLTIEYCSNKHQEYRDAIRNTARAVKPNGHFIMGGVLEETWCAFGGVQFTCLYITQDFVTECLRNAGIDTDPERGFLFWVSNGIFMCCGRKMSTTEYREMMGLKVNKENDDQQEMTPQREE